MRIKLSKITRKHFFDDIKRKTGLARKGLANLCKVDRKTFSDWETGKYTMPIKCLNKLIKIGGITPPKLQQLPDFWHIRAAGKKGGINNYSLHGNPGTSEGRSRGGKISSKKFSQNPSLAKKTGFIIRKNIAFPKKSTRLAEFIGIVLGDGGISKYQTVITLHNTDDREFALYVAELIKSLFNIRAGLYKRHSIVNIVVSRKNLIEFLLKQGLQIGSKVKNQIDVPSWIKEKNTYTKSCVRGLFDTDGCFYIDKHAHNDKIYANPAINFTNRSSPLLIFFKITLEKFGFHPTQGTKYSISLRREKEIYNFFKDVGSSNPKHIKKFVKYFTQKYGEVPKWL